MPLKSLVGAGYSPAPGAKMLQEREGGPVAGKAYAAMSATLAGGYITNSGTPVVQVGVKGMDAVAEGALVAVQIGQWSS